VITTVEVAVTVPQPPEAGTVYVTVYVPPVLEDGVTAPVEALIVNPAGELVYAPPVYAPVPVKETD
jgi:hypothetical protein